MTSVGEIALRCVEALEADGIPCAVGGAIALGFWCPPRATLDVDLNIFVSADDVHRALAPLLALGVQGEMDTMKARLQQGEAGMLYLDGVRLDIFLPSIPFYAEAARRVVRLKFLGRTLPVLSAETLAVFKMLFFRKKDLADLERLLAFQGPALDAMWVRAQLADMMGDDDERVAAWDRLVADAVG